SLSNPDALLEKMIKYKPTGGTSFDNGIKKAAEIIDPSKSYLYLYTIKFAGTTGIANTTSIVGGFFGLFGGNSHGQGRNTNYSHDQGSLQEMANIAKEYLPKSSNNKDSLKCEYVRVIDRIDLIGHFYEVAESIRNYKPTLINVNKK
ncbi:2122_t:CDS:2, partial [Diversispora eburnea]